MSDLHEFPYFEVTEEGFTEDQFQKRIQENYLLNVQAFKKLPAISQSFTRYQARLDPVQFTCEEPLSVEGLQWIALNDLKKLAFSSGHRRIFQLVQE